LRNDAAVRSLSEGCDADIERGLFFIVGTGRCGSTLLRAILSSHSRIAIPPETHFFVEWDPALFEGDPLADDDAVDRLIGRASRLWFWEDLQLDAQRLRDATINGERSAKAMFVNMLEQWREKLGKPRLGEKTPAHQKSVERILHLFPNAKIVHIYRDPRDVVASIIKLRWGGHDSVLRHAKSWAKVMRRHLERQRALPANQYYSMQFEKLVCEPEATLRSLCNFLGEQFEPALLQHSDRGSSVFTAGEIQRRSDAIKPIEAGVVGKGLTSLSPRHVRTVERVAGPLLEAMGYERASGPSDRMRWWAMDSAESALWSGRRLARSVGKRLGVPMSSPGFGPLRKQLELKMAQEKEISQRRSV